MAIALKPHMTQSRIDKTVFRWREPIALLALTGSLCAILTHGCEPEQQEVSVNSKANVRSKRSAVLSGLVAAYGFGEGTGTTTADSSGSGFTGTMGSTASWSTAGKFGN